MPVPITVSAVDNAGNLLTDYTGTVSIFSTDPAATGITYTFTAADAGTHTFDPGIALVSVGPQSIIVTVPLAGSASATVQAQVRRRLRVLPCRLRRDDVQAALCFHLR